MAALKIEYCSFSSNITLGQPGNRPLRRGQAWPRFGFLDMEPCRDAVYSTKIPGKREHERLLSGQILS